MDDLEAVAQGLHAVLRGRRARSGPAAASSAAARSRRTSASRASPRTSRASAPCASCWPGATSSSGDIEAASLVAVIGTDLSDAFFGTMEPLGKEIDVDGHMLKVIGVAEKKGVVFGESQDNFLWIPITTFSQALRLAPLVQRPGRGGLDGVFEAAQDQVRVAMRARRHLTYDKPDDFSIETGESIMELWQTHDARHLRGDAGGDRDQPARRRDRGDEHHAGLGHRADQGDRRAGRRSAPAAATSCASSWSSR